MGGFELERIIWKTRLTLETVVPLDNWGISAPFVHCSQDDPLSIEASTIAAVSGWPVPSKSDQHT